MSEAYKSWEEYTPLEQAACTWYDMYKDAHGFRPRSTDTSTWTLEQFQSEMEHLQTVIHASERQRELDEAFNIKRFEARIASIIELGARDRAMALRWIHEAEGSDGDDEYLCYCVGVPYGYIKTDGDSMSQTYSATYGYDGEYKDFGTDELAAQDFEDSLEEIDPIE
jgi:hypothetical protein